MPQRILVDIEKHDDRLILFKCSDKITFHSQINDEIQYRDKLSKAECGRRLDELLERVNDMVDAGEGFNIGFKYDRRRTYWLCPCENTDSAILAYGQHVDKTRLMHQLKSFCNQVKEKLGLTVERLDHTSEAVAKFT